MSDLGGGGPVSVAVSNTRIQNGGSRAASGSGPTAQHPSSGARTPTEIMRQRRLRDEKKRAAELEAKEREREGAKVRVEEENLDTDRKTAAGVAPANVTGGEISGQRRSGVLSTTRRSGGEVGAPPISTDRKAGERRSVSGTNINPVTANQPPVYVPASSRQENASATPRAANDPPAIPQTTSRKQRASTVAQGQPRPVQQQQAPPRAASATFSTQPQTSQAKQTSSAAVNSKEQADLSASASGFRPQPGPDQPTGAQARNTNASSFPHAFERWENLSSHWEGLTGYWIRKLEQNGEEMDRIPLNQQMARQVTDLSAAGANLFHAVVELQRLRASSERKFQRWFFETRAEQERAQEAQAGLENTLRVERQARADAVAELARMETEKNSAYQTKSNAEQMVREMRRELQISKEEARRAWEELGRREQEERDRTTSLKNGEPTLVGGVQVVPMIQGASSRQESLNRPSTREGPYPSGPNLSSLPGASEAVESPLDERGYTNYDPTRSETDTDPFTEGGRGGSSQPSYREPYLSPPAVTSYPKKPTSNGSSAVGAQAPESRQEQSVSESTGAGGTYLRYGPEGSTSQAGAPSFYQHEGPTLHQDNPRTTEQDERSYVQSVGTVSEEDYEMNDNGEVRHDEQGRPIPFGSGLGSEDSDENDVQVLQERERMYGYQYGTNISGVEYGHGPTGGVEPTFTTGTLQGAQIAPVDYSGSEYGSRLGWDAVLPRHHHPTRLSDVLEEDERSRTSPSRASQTSRGIR